MPVDAGPCNVCGAREWQPRFREHGFQLGRCMRCDLHFVHPIPSAEARLAEMETGRFPGGKVADAGLHLAGEQARHPELCKYVDTIVSYKPPVGPWLDIGCGTGTLMALIRERGYQAEGIELTKDRRETAKRVTGCPVYDEPIELLNVPPKTYAAVLMINVFSHLTDPMGTLAVVHDALVPGGILLLRTGEIVGHVRRHHAFSWDLGDHLYWLGERTFSIIAAKMGWTILSRERQWSPALIYTRERFLMPGRSRRRNQIKAMIARTPGAMALLRFYLLRWRERDNALYASTLVLRKEA